MVSRAPTLSLLTAILAGVATAESLPEGVITEIQAPEEVDWTVETGTRRLLIRSGEGGLDIETTGRYGGVEQISLTPNSFRGLERNMAPGNPLTAKALSGSGHVLLARNDFITNYPQGGPLSHRLVSDTLEVDGCAAYEFTSTFMNEPARVQAAGGGFRFVLMDDQMNTQTSTRDTMTATMDPERVFGLIVQLCRENATNPEFTIELTYPHPDAAELGAPLNPTPIDVSVGISALLLASILCSRARNR